MASKVSAVQQPSYGSQLQQNLSAQGGISNQLLGLEQAFGPQQTQFASGLQNQAFGAGVQGVGQYAPQLQSLASQGQMQAIQQNPVYNNLYNTALQQSSLGGALSQNQQLQVQQGALQGLAGAGRANTNASIFDQILGRTNYTNTNLQQQLSNVGSAMSGLPTQGAGFVGASNSLIGNSGSAASQGISPWQFNPQSSYAQNINDANQSSQMQANVMNANASNYLTGGLLSGIGGILGGPIGGQLLFGSQNPFTNGANSK